MICCDFYTLIFGTKNQIHIFVIFFGQNLRFSNSVYVGGLSFAAIIRPWQQFSSQFEMSEFWSKTCWDIWYKACRVTVATVTRNSYLRMQWRRKERN